MKKLVSLMLCALLIAAAFAGCSGAKDKAESDAPSSATDKMPTVLNTAEYTLYQNIFYNDRKGDYDGKETKKEGTFATLYDAYNDVTRYYVWGYNDQTKCCDWQWEIKLDDESNLPSNGSLVEVSATYEVNDKALDGLWLIKPQLTVKTAFKARDCDIDMQAMDNTLERVQMTNIVNKKEAFEGKKVLAYGRVLDEKTLQDAYYDGSWTASMSGDYEVPAFGTIVLVSATVQDGALADCELSQNTQY